MLALLGFIPTILTTITGLGTSGSSIAKSISDAQIAREKTKSDTKLKEIDAEIAALHDRANVLVAEAGARVNGAIRAVLALTTVPLLIKILFWDPVIGSFMGCAGKPASTPGCSTFLTDAIDPNRWWVVGAVIAFYFVATSFGKK